MFNKSQMTNLRILTSGCGRFPSRRNSIIKLTLVVLLLGTPLWIFLMRLWADSGDFQTIPKDISSSGENTSKNAPSKKTRITNLSKLINGRSSFFKRDQFTDEALRGNGLIPVTAIVLNWKRMEGLQVVVNYISKYPYIKEILIWNNNNEVKLRRQNFKLNNTDITLNVFNSEENLHDLSKYITCSMAKYDYCYFQDDDWLNLYMDSTYTNFIRNPSLIHSNTMPIIHLEHRRWTFSNDDKNLHTGFTWLGCGSFVPREKVLRFLGQIGSIPLVKERLRLLDMYFSLWTNQYPYQLSNPLISLDQRDAWSKNVDQWSVVYASILDAIQKLYTALAVNAGSDRFAREEEKPHYSDRDVRAPCTNDKCLFITNIDPFPHPSSVYYTNNITHVHEQEAKFNALDFPNNKFWNKHAYHKAVDSNSSTCWNSFKNPKAGDYFGLQFVEPQPCRKITVVSSKDISSFDASLTIETSLDGDNWQICNQTSSSQDYIGSPTIPSSHSITMSFDCASTNRPFCFIRLRTRRNFTEPLEICSLILDELSV